MDILAQADFIERKQEGEKNKMKGKIQFSNQIVQVQLIALHFTKFPCREKKELGQLNWSLYKMWFCVRICVCVCVCPNI